MPGKIPGFLYRFIRLCKETPQDERQLQRAYIPYAVIKPEYTGLVLATNVLLADGNGWVIQMVTG